jgi:protease-4
LRLDRWIAGGTRIVVVHLEGPVVDGPGAPGATAIADVPTRKLLDGLARDDAVAGVVLAVQSPGGSAQASELIWRAIRRLGEQKPVVAALGKVAASGGYYIAVAAREILAHPATLTGSIGVVAAKVVVGGALGKLGATSEAVLGAPQADFFSGESPFSDEQRRRFRVVLAETYARFVGRVAEGRGRTPEDTEPLAQGRVWLGTRAVASGLADGFGDVDAAVRRVAELAAVQRPRRVDAWVSPRANRLFARLRPGLVAEVWLRQLREQPGKVLAVAEVEIDLG